MNFYTSRGALLVCFTFQIFVAASTAEDPDVHRNTVQLIISRGYTAETHEIQTEDSYILTYYRIPHGKNTNITTRGAVLLQHGLLGTSFDWFLQNDNHILPFLLAEEGYDVWLGNARGTSYSLKHVNLTQNDPAFWKFSWQEMGEYDIPAGIDYILRQNNFTKRCVHYIGHSMGTTQFFVMAAKKPEYNSKICLMSAFAPVAFMSHMRSPLRALGPIAEVATITNGGDIVTDLGAGKQLPDVLLKAINNVGPVVCSQPMVARNLCANVFFVIGGFDESQMNDTKLPMVVAHFPDSTSVKTFIHYGQVINSGRFAEFDRGLLDVFPPKFDTTKMTAPIALYWGENDWLADPTDVDNFSKLLPNRVRNYRVPLPEFNHFDFVSAIDAYELLYKTTIQYMEKF